MKVCFVSRKGIISALVLIGLLVSIFSGFVIYTNSISSASYMQEPIYQGNTGQKAVSITVNVDWGEEFIPEMLKEFEKSGARVSFFVTGNWAEKNAELLKNMHEQGHSIQNHGYKHVHFASLSSTQTAEEIRKAEEVIYNITGNKTRFFAPPYGEQNRQILQGVHSLGYDLIMWSVDTIDWQRPGPDTIVKRVINKVHNDAIILMHPTEPSLKALPQLLKYLKDEGYQIVTIDQIIIKKDSE